MNSGQNPVVSVVIGSYNRRDFLKAALKSVRSNGMDFPYEIIVVDGGSTEGTLRYLEKQKDVITIIQHNRGTFRGKEIRRRSWGYFMNLGFKIAQGKYILMISDDSLLVPGAVKNGVENFDKLLTEGENVGAMAFYWRNWPEQQDYWVGLTLGDRMIVNHGMYLRSAVEEVGWIEEERYKFYYADSDLCLKLWHRGYLTVDCKTAFIEHCDHMKASAKSFEKDLKAYLEYWDGIFSTVEEQSKGWWIYQSYSDPHRTIRLFPLMIRVQFWARDKFLEITQFIKQKLKYILRLR